MWVCHWASHKIGSIMRIDGRALKIVYAVALGAIWIWVKIIRGPLWANFWAKLGLFFNYNHCISASIYLKMFKSSLRTWRTHRIVSCLEKCIKSYLGNVCSTIRSCYGYFCCSFASTSLGWLNSQAWNFNRNDNLSVGLLGPCWLGFAWP